jgi:hypothetical protein
MIALLQRRIGTTPPKQTCESRPSGSAPTTTRSAKASRPRSSLGHQGDLVGCPVPGPVMQHRQVPDPPAALDQVNPAFPRWDFRAATSRCRPGEEFPARPVLRPDRFGQPLDGPARRRGLQRADEVGKLSLDTGAVFGLSTCSNSRGFGSSRRWWWSCECRAARVGPAAPAAAASARPRPLHECTGVNTQCETSLPLLVRTRSDPLISYRKDLFCALKPLDVWVAGRLICVFVLAATPRTCPS